VNSHNKIGHQGVTDSEKPVNSNAHLATPKAEPSEWREYGKFLFKLAAIVLIFRTAVFAPFNIPSESMQPRLLIGDYLLVAKWPYGFSRYSLPFHVPLFEGRILDSLPERGDVVVFKGPGERSNVDFIKRAIGLPGDVIAMRTGVLEINGVPVKMKRLPDFVTPVTQGMRDAAALNNRPSPCWRPEFEEPGKDGGTQCRYRHFLETLPNGRSHEILDIADAQSADDIEPILVPEGQILFMGDSRDNSADSRKPDNGEWIGLIPAEHIVGRAQFTWFSTDGSARWLLPWTWFSAARPERMFKGF
jgi:signal peptidase I